MTPLEVISLYPKHNYTLQSLFETRRQANPSKPFVLFKDQTWTWGEFADAIERMHREGAYMRVYWEGAALMLMADQRLRERCRSDPIPRVDPHAGDRRFRRRKPNRNMNSDRSKLNLNVNAAIDLNRNFNEEGRP